MVDAGARPIDEVPRPGSRGTTVTFIHPKGSHGTLIELVEEWGCCFRSLGKNMKVHLVDGTYELSAIILELHPT